MNIFVLDQDTKKSSQYHVDKHVVKMPLETAQMLCTAHYLAYNNLEAPYKPTHYAHPCNLWLIESLDNYKWLCELGLNLCHEYTYRYGKIHKCQNVIEWCMNNEPNLISIGLTKFALAMPNECKKDCAIESYRTYYRENKIHLHNWKKRVKPEWL